MPRLRVLSPRRTGPGAALIDRLKELGCVFCYRCNAYLMPEHVCVQQWLKPREVNPTRLPGI